VDHSYWWVSDKTGKHHVISGGSELGPPKFGHVWTWDVEGDYGHYGHGEGPQQSTQFYAPVSTETCKKVDKIIEARENWPMNAYEYGR
jgi:hypothetical protein